jgi:hypothetical protein
VPVKSLLFARKQQEATNDSIAQNVLVVAMPTTPERTSLPFVEREVENLEAVLSNKIPYVILRNPSKTETLKRLVDEHVVHSRATGRLQLPIYHKVVSCSKTGK